MARRDRTGKGSFGRAKLPVASAYPSRWRRPGLLAAGAASGAAAVAWVIGSVLFGGGGIVAPGPVASSHASIESTCGSCHRPIQGVVAEGCLDCHERVADRPGSLGFAAHYAYRGGVVAEGAPATGSSALRGHAHEMTCSDCHREHRGRRAALTAVPDSLCTSCHPYRSFERDHPEIEVLRADIPDDPNLSFPHRLHVAEVGKRLGLTDPVAACLECHEPDRRGAGFGPIDFDRHCDACHLTASTGTPRLPVGDPADPEVPGVLTLEDFRREWGPEARWTAFTNPEEIRQAGGVVSRRPVYHEDPWILANLRHIRGTLYGDLGLGGLLDTAVDRGTLLGEEGALYEEAIAALEERATVLRAVPSSAVQEELRRIEALLARARERAAGGETSGSLAPFVAGQRDPGVSDAHAARLERLALDLTTPCRQCHVVSDAAIQRVQADQRTLVRAEFDHRAHRLQRADCTSCHGAISRILDGEPKEEDDPTDVAATHNLPSIAVCQECHRAEAVTDSCVTCHRFHPDHGRHAAVRFLRSSGRSAQ